MKEMSLVDHLEELRSRLIHIFFILVVGFGICYSSGEHIAEFLMAPLREALGTDGKIV